VRALTEINMANNADAYPWISPDGLRLYYKDGSNSLYMFTQRADTNSFFTTPTVLQISAFNILSCWLSNDELDLYYSDSQNIYYASRPTVTSPFNSPTNINLSGPMFTFISGPSLNNSQDEMYVYITNPVSGDANTFRYLRTSPTSFSFADSISYQGPTASPGQLSKDDLTYFVSLRNGTNRILYELTRASVTDTFSITTLQQIQGINNSLYNNMQPSMSDDLKWVAFVRSLADNWNENDLYIANRSGTTSVFDPALAKTVYTIFPNPSNEKFIFSASGDKKLELEIYNILGNKIKTLINSDTDQTISFDLSDFSKGIYFLKIFDGNTTIGIEKLILN
jgi:hypothetical protein